MPLPDLALRIPANQTETQPPEKRIVVLLPNGNTDYWQQVIYGIDQETDETMSVQVTQISQTDTLLRCLQREMLR